MGALSLATDLGLGQPLEFALQACVVAVRLGEKLKFSDAELRATNYQALLRYIGCSAETRLIAALFGDELALRANAIHADLTRAISLCWPASFARPTPLPVTSVEALMAYVCDYRTAIPDMRFTTDDLLAEADKVLWRFTASGTQTGALGPIPPTGNRVTVTGMALFRLANGKIAEVWVNFDALGLMQQIDVIPAMA